MLFDLQSPGRRRVVRITFGTLAVIFALSFVLLGVGTGGGSSIADLFGGGGGDASSAFDDDIKAQEQALAANPNDTNALAQLVTLHYQAGNQQVDENGLLTSDGEQELQQAADAWNRYEKATKGNLAQGPTLLALQTFDRLGSASFEQARSSSSGSAALTEVNSATANWKEAASVQQLLIDKQPTPSNYARLASYLYLSGQEQAGDQAASQAGKGPNASAIQQQLQPIKQLGAQLQQAIAQFTKQQQQTQGAGATGGGNPLGGVGGGGLSPGGLSGGGLSGGP